MCGSLLVHTNTKLHTASGLLGAPDLSNSHPLVHPIRFPAQEIPPKSIMTQQNSLVLRKVLLDNKHYMETVNIVFRTDYKYLNAMFSFKQSPPQASHLESLF